MSKACLGNYIFECLRKNTDLQLQIVYVYRTQTQVSASMYLVLNIRPSGFPKVCKILLVRLQLWVCTVHIPGSAQGRDLGKHFICFCRNYLFTLLGKKLPVWWKIIYFVLSVLTIILLVLCHRLEKKNTGTGPTRNFFILNLNRKVKLPIVLFF